MYFLTKHPYHRNIAAIFVLFLTFFTTQNANAQCNCSKDPTFIIGTSSGSETYLSDWIATNPSFPQNTLSGPCLQVFGTLNIDKNYTFTGLTITMMPGSSISVLSGFALTITGNAKLQACKTPPFNRLWKGITVWEGSSLFLNQASISDAEIAVSIQDNTTLQLHRTNFNKNYIGLFFVGDGGDAGNSGSVNLVNPASVSRCSFTCFGTLLQNENGVTVADRSEYGILLNNCDFFNVGVNAAGSSNINSFFNQEGCIRAIDCEGLGVFNTVMTSITSTDTPMLYGIFTTNCTNNVAINHNKISKVGDGIFQEFSDLKASNNTIVALYNGIYCQNLYNRNARIAGQNSIHGNNGGIVIQNAGSPYWLQNVIEIADNKLIPGAGDFGGINVTRNSSLLWIHDNPDIKALGNIANGIYLSLCTGKGLIHNNVINQPSVSGILLFYVEGYQFVQTTINGGDFGVWATMAENNLFCCTAANGCNTGIRFQTSCSDTRLWNTEFDKNLIGLEQSESALLSQQDNRGNRWNLDPLTAEDAVYYGSDDPNGLIQYNQYRISKPFKPNENTSTTVIQAAGAYGNPDNWHKINTLYDPSCTVPQGGSPQTYCGEESNVINLALEPWDGFSTLSPLDTWVMQGESGLDAEMNALNWLQRQYLYKKTKHNTTFRNSDPSLSTFFTDSQIGVLGKLEAIESACWNLFSIPQNSQTQYNLLWSQSQTLLESIGQLDLMLDDTTGGNPPSILAQRLTLIQNAIGINTQIQQIEDTAKQARLARMPALIAENNSISTTDIWQQNEKTVFGIILSTIGSDIAISDNQKSIVEAIAAQCPKTGGRGVVWARAVKKGWDLSPDDNSCFATTPMVGQGTQERFKGSSSTKTGFKAYPSPASEGLFTLEIPKLEALGGNFSLMDVSSKVWLSQKIQISQTTAQFDVSQMPNGLYLYTYKGLDGIVHAGKIIVQNN